MVQTTEVKKNLPQWGNIPEDLKDEPRWVAYKLVWDEKKQKYNKPPHSLCGSRAQSYDIHYAFEEVKVAVEAGHVDGVGFAMTEQDNFICIDLDGESIEDIPRSLMSISEHSYAELSPSGNGLHVWFRGDKPSGAGGKQNRYTNKERYKVECFYDTGFLTVTGNKYNDLPIEENQMILDFLYDNTSHKNNEAAPSIPDELLIPKDEMADAKVIEKMINSKQSGAKIKALLNGDTSFNGNDHSAADIALSNYLAIYTKCNADQIDRIFRTTGLMREKWDVVHHSSGETYGEYTVKKAIEWAYPKMMQSVGKEVEHGLEYWTEDSKEILIPEPFLIEYDTLKKKVLVKVDGFEVEENKIICRHAPIINKIFSNVERNQIYYSLKWNDDKKKSTEIVPAIDVSARNKLINMADKGLAVNDLNVKDLINYFDKYIMFNDIPREPLVERLGHVLNGFVHPLLTNVKILPPDLGDAQTVEAFQTSGTAEEWISNVFLKVEKYPKAVLMLLASFTSIILKDLKLSPFIIDLSGPTSKGKTTALKVAASVWGTGRLVSEWNITKVAAERKAAFLNSFPLLLDDTMKADERQLKSFVYNFSGGRSKGRGSLTGTQTEVTWNNLLLSTGENSLVEYAKEAGGAAARVLPITGLPFENADYVFFNEIYEAIELNHGAIGLAFSQLWHERKAELLPQYKEYNDIFQKKANGNEVLSRIARHYAAIVFTGHVLINFFNMPIDLMALDYLFDVMIKENSAIDKPMERLEDILIDLDAKRECISGKYEAKQDLKAIFKNGTLYLLPAYLKEFLGPEMSQIRKEWSRRGISTGVKGAGSYSLKHLSKTHRVVPVEKTILEKLDYDFEFQ